MSASAAAAGASDLSSPHSTRPVPSSITWSIRAAISRRIESSQRTGWVSWRLSAERTASALRTSTASTLVRIGQRGSCTGTASIAAASWSAAGFMSGEWNAPLTGSRIARLAPAALASSQACFTASTSPEITICPGALKFAGTTSRSAVLAAAHTSTTFAASSPRIAAMVPGRALPAPCMSSPRRRTRRSASS